MRLHWPIRNRQNYAAALAFTVVWGAVAGQEKQPKEPAKPAAQVGEKAGKSEKAANPAQIELLETKVRFEANGDSRKEVHARVKINSELGVRQFARLNFDFNRSFESAEIPLVHITHATGGSLDMLPSAVTDQPNAAVANAPDYQDVRVKSVRILGLEPGDTLEYRVLKTVAHHPLAPDFWLDHTFDRTGVVSHEVFELDLPDKPVIALADRRLLTQAVTNLVKNASEAIDTAVEADPARAGSGHIVANVGTKGDRLQITVIDNGCGLPKENRERLVEPYMTTREKGTGLGLAIVQRITEQHGGTLTLADAPRRNGKIEGASVRMDLPLG